jgi:hypothetical protein
MSADYVNVTDLEGIVALAKTLPDPDAESNGYYLDGHLRVLHGDGWVVCQLSTGDGRWVVDFTDHGKDVK